MDLNEIQNTNIPVQFDFGVSEAQKESLQMQNQTPNKQNKHQRKPRNEVERKREPNNSNEEQLDQFKKLSPAKRLFN